VIAAPRPGLTLTEAEGGAASYCHANSGFCFVLRPLTAPATPFTLHGRNADPAKAVGACCA